MSAARSAEDHYLKHLVCPKRRKETVSSMPMSSSVPSAEIRSVIPEGLLEFQKPFAGEPPDCRTAISGTCFD